MHYTVIDPEGRSYTVESVKVTENNIVVGWVNYIMSRLPFPVDSAIVYDDRVVYKINGYKLIERHL